MFKKLANTLLDRAENALVREATKALSPHVDSLVEGAVNAIVNSGPAVRSTGGGTSVYLTKVQSDFKDFHAEDADNAIQTFMLEYLQIIYGQMEKFEKSNVSEKVTFNFGTITKKTLTDIKINQMSIADYIKSLNSATLKYRVSIGFNVNGSREERLYELEYTLQLRDEYGAQTFLECQHCGAPLEESSGECKYCGTKHLRDTTDSWVITNITQK